MLIDPSFSRAIFTSPSDALAGLELTDDETGWLLNSDPRAWRLDPMRRTRMLQSLLEEFPVSAALTLQHDGHAEHLDAFFSSPQLHQAVQTRGLLSRAFGRYMATLEVRGLAPIRAIEASIVECRRGDEAPALPSGWIGLASAHDILRLPSGSLERYVSYSGTLARESAERGSPVLETMLSDGFTLVDAFAPPSATHEYILVEPSPDGPRLGEVSEALGALLEAAKPGVARSTLLNVACTLGAEPDEAEELLQELSAEGLLT